MAWFGSLRAARFAKASFAIASHHNLAVPVKEGACIRQCAFAKYLEG